MEKDDELFFDPVDLQGIIYSNLDDDIANISSLMDIDFLRYLNQYNTGEIGEFINKMTEDGLAIEKLNDIKKGYAEQDSLARYIAWKAWETESQSLYKVILTFMNEYWEKNKEPEPAMTREGFTELFSKEMNARGYPVTESYRVGIFFHNKSDNREFILRFEGKTEGEEWLVSGQDSNYFEFQVQDYDSYNRDNDYDGHSTQMDYDIDKADMKEFVDWVIEAVGEYYE